MSELTFKRMRIRLISLDLKNEIDVASIIPDDYGGANIEIIYKKPIGITESIKDFEHSYLVCGDCDVMYKLRLDNYIIEIEYRGLECFAKVRVIEAIELKEEEIPKKFRDMKVKKELLGIYD